MADETPGERLKGVIEALGVSYSEFGKMVAGAERPPRAKPYGRNNVGEWTSDRSGLKPRTWDAIERVTGKPMSWYLYGERPAKPRPVTTYPPVDPLPAVSIPKKSVKRRQKGNGP